MFLMEDEQQAKRFKLFTISSSKLLFDAFVFTWKIINKNFYKVDRVKRGTSCLLLRISSCKTLMIEAYLKSCQWLFLQESSIIYVLQGFEYASGWYTWYFNGFWIRRSATYMVLHCIFALALNFPHQGEMFSKSAVNAPCKLMIRDTPFNWWCIV